MKTIVTGGAGFIGSHLVGALVARGEEVIVLDDFSSGRTRIPGAEYIEIDIADWKNIPRIEETLTGADYVFHLAARVGVKNCYEHPEISYRTNVLGSHIILDACMHLGIRMLDVSSSSVYGRADNKTVSEQSDIVFGDPGNKSWQYGIHKAVAEAEARNAGMNVVRLFNVVGTRQRGDYGFVVPKFVSQIMTGKPVTVYGDGTQTRSFADVRDVVNGLLLVREKGVGGEVYNLGSEQEVPIKDLATLMLQTLNRTADIQFIPRAEAIGADYEETLKRLPDLTKIRALGYTTEHTLDHSIEWIAREEYAWNN
jgi:UDP-glucose 4-epimerase